MFCSVKTVSFARRPLLNISTLIFCVTDVSYDVFMWYIQLIMIVCVCFDVFVIVGNCFFLGGRFPFGGSVTS